MRSALLLALLVVSAVPLSAQRYDDAITVNVVDVPVYVERFGVPIKGLTREDFELFVNGKPHPIEYFDVVDQRAGENAPATASAPVELKRRRLIVLLFDVAAPPWSLQRARKAAARYVDEGASGDTFAVATVGYSGVLFIVPFTADRIAVQRAIATLRPSAARDPFRVATLDVERSRGGVGGADAGRGVFGGIWGGHPEGRLPGSLPGFYEPPAIAGWYTGAAIDRDGAQNDFSSRGLIDNLNTLADRLAPLEGLKEVVLLSEGNSDPDAAFSWAGRLAAFTRLHKRFRAAGVILNAVDIGTPSAPGGGIERVSTTTNVTPNFLASNFLWSLALDTGGIATTSLPHLQERHRLSYVIGFRPPASRSKQNSISVRVRNQPILTDVRYRKSYSLDREPTDDGLFLADTLLNDIPQNGVTVDLSVNGKWVAASIPGVELLSYAPERRLSLDVYFYVFDGQQRPVAWNRMQITVDLDKGREFLSTNPYTMRQEFVLEPGRYVAKALVRIAGTDRMGFRRTAFEVQP